MDCPLLFLLIHKQGEHKPFHILLTLDGWYVPVKEPFLLVRGAFSRRKFLQRPQGFQFQDLVICVNLEITLVIGVDGFWIERKPLNEQLV